MAGSRTIFTWEMNSIIKKSIDATVFRGKKNNNPLAKVSERSLSGGKEEKMWKEWTGISRYLKDDLVSQLFFFFFFRFIYLFISACFLLGLCCCPQTFSSCHKQEWLFIAAHAFIALASLAAERVLGTWPSAVAARRLSICGAAFWSVFWPPCLSRACSHPTFSPWRRCVLAQSRSHQPPESSFGSLPAGFQREGLWERIVWEQHGSDDEKSAPGGQPEECSWPEEQVQSSELQKHLAIPRERKKSRRGAWREEAGRATDELAVPLDISRTPCPCKSDQLMEFLRENNLQHFMECDWLVRSNERGN